MEKNFWQENFSAKKIALAGIFTALGYAISFLEFPIFGATPFLKFDFSFSILLIGAFMLGPLLGEISIVIQQALRLPFSSSGGVGELANFIVATCFIFVPSLIYHFKKGLPTVFISLFIGTVLQVFAALLTNRYILFPLYMGNGASSVFKDVFYYIVAFNFIKCVVNSAITLLLYKRLKNLLNKWFF